MHHSTHTSNHCHRLPPPIISELPNISDPNFGNLCSPAKVIYCSLTWTPRRISTHERLENNQRWVGLKQRSRAYYEFLKREAQYVVRPYCLSSDISLYMQCPRDQYDGELRVISIAADLLYFRSFRTNDLPPQILSVIFELAASDEVATKIRITAVCRLWRNIALGDCNLWNSIDFDDFPKFGRSIAFLARSRRSPINVCIKDIPPSKTKARPSSLFHHLISSVSPSHAHDIARYWRNLGHVSHLRQPTSFQVTGQTMETILGILSPHFFRVRTLTVHCLDWSLYIRLLSSRLLLSNAAHIDLSRFIPGDPDPEQLVCMSYPIENLPLITGGTNLRKLVIRSMYFAWGTSNLSHLHTLDLSWIPGGRYAMDVATFRNILVSSPRLHTLRIEATAIGGETGGRQSPPVVQLPSLHTLLLASLHTHALHRFLAVFGAPNVRDLSLKGVVVDEMLMGRMPRVEKLTIRDVTYSSLGTLERFAQGLSRLVSLVDKDGIVICAFVDAPRLREVKVGNPAASSVVRFVARRDAIGRQVRIVAV